MNASHAVRVIVEYHGADGGTEDVGSIDGLFLLLLSRPSARLKVLRCLEEWQQPRELSGLWAMSRRLPHPWVLLEEVGKTFTSAGKAPPAPPAPNAEESRQPGQPDSILSRTTKGGCAGRSGPASPTPTLPLRA